MYISRHIQIYLTFIFKKDEVGFNESSENFGLATTRLGPLFDSYISWFGTTLSLGFMVVLAIVRSSSNQTWLAGKGTLEINDLPSWKPLFSAGIFQLAMFGYQRANFRKLWQLDSDGVWRFLLLAFSLWWVYYRELLLFWAIRRGHPYLTCRVVLPPCLRGHIDPSNQGP